jgi:hypothetical protein
MWLIRRGDGKAKVKPICRSQLIVMMDWEWISTYLSTTPEVQEREIDEEKLVDYENETIRLMLDGSQQEHELQFGSYAPPPNINLIQSFMSYPTTSATENYPDRLTSIYDLSKYMLGQQSDDDTNALIPIHMTVRESLVVDDEASMLSLYSHLLRMLPNDIDPVELGLGSILTMHQLGSNIVVGPRVDELEDGSPDVNYMSWAMDGRINLTRLVWWVNSTVLRYLPWYGCIDSMVKHFKKSKNAPRYMPTMLCPMIDETNLPLIVDLVGKTLGIYAMRRMLLSLLHYIQREEGDAFVLVRADVFAILIEKYIEEHDGDDEGSKTLNLRSVLDNSE